ncbi:BTB domain-containing protein [Mycena kentingensis (nom. inval.)]|nr:BTB domain-containing protein [Mycena kentingensis (nom. inval.)]
MDLDDDSKMADAATDVPVVRHPQYYISDGNTVLRVENTLFRVHRSMLIKDKSAFDSMFSLESFTHDTSEDAQAPTYHQEGEDDEHPILLLGDKADEFSALMWSLYSLPAEIAISMGIQANDAQLINLARIAHKYQFRTTESWALAALTTYHSNTTGSPNVQNLIEITELASLCEYKALLNAAVVKWRRLLSEGRAVASAIDVAERLSIKPLLGLAYYSMMLKGREVWDADPQLQRRQRIRLLSGHYNIIRICEDLPEMPPRITHDQACIRKGRCRNAFGFLWRTILTVKEHGIAGKVQSVDYLKKLTAAEGIIKAIAEGSLPHLDLGDQGDVHEKCMPIILQATHDKVKEVQDNLVHWFSDVP